MADTIGDNDQVPKPVVKPKVAETARQERAQGGQPQAASSGDRIVNAAGPHDRSDLTTKATEGTGMLPSTSVASDEDMAPGG